jgi:hypothetical protein
MPRKPARKRDKTVDAELRPTDTDSPIPYDPLDLRTLAENMVKVVLEQHLHPMASLKPFDGSGIYVIYYTGTFEPYKPIAEKNEREKWEQPIYVGEATRKGGRKGGVLAEGPPGKAIFERIGNHVDSIKSVPSLNVQDFWCRYLVLKDFFIPLCESLLIDRYKPIWNKVIDGFGNKALGGPRQREQQKSMWDVLHPGRPGAAISPHKKYPDAKILIDKIEKFYAGEPVALIPTDKAVDAAEEDGRMQADEEEE